MAQNFITCDRGQVFLMPASLVDWVPEDHLVWTVLGAVDQMDLSAFYGAYRANGQGRGEAGFSCGKNSRKARTQGPRERGNMEVRARRRHDSRRGRRRYKGAREQGSKKDREQGTGNREKETGKLECR